jgi:membrane associated rhomboid family serine protease
MIPIRDTVPSRSPPVAVYALIAVNVVVFAFELSLPDEELDRLFYLLGIVPARYTHPDGAQQVGFPADDYWPLLTSMFLHGGWAHILGNMWTLWIFGDNVEDHMGPARFTIFFILPAGWWRASFNGTPIRIPPYLRSVPREPSRVSLERTLYSSRTRG